MTTDQNIEIDGVPETMLWTLHNRASEAMRTDGLIQDEHCIQIYKSINYDYQRNFGKPDASHGFRSKAFDDFVRRWLKSNDGPVIELGAGLETQFYRINHPTVDWYVVDLPEAIAVREKFVPKNERLKGIAKSALDFSWLSDVPDSDNGRAFVSIQGLLMYFEKADVRELLQAIFKKYPKATVAFDVIPKWLSQKTIKGWQKTKFYKTPAMPWGIDRNEIKDTLFQWLSRDHEVEFVDYRFRGPSGVAFLLFSKMPILRNWTPLIVQVSPLDKT